MDLAQIARIVASTRNPRLDPRFNTWPLPPLWMLPPTGGRLNWSNPQLPAPLMRAFTQDHPEAFGASGWNYGSGGNPGVEGDLFIGKDKAPRTGGYVYGLHNWFPQEQNYLPPRRA